MAYTLAEVAERAGVSPEAARDRLRDLGLTVPESEPAFGDAEVAAVERGKAFHDPGLTRFMAGSIERVADPVRHLFGEQADELIPAAAADFEYLLRRHLSDIEHCEHLPEGEMDEVAAAFADIVGFTALGEELPPAELSGIAERLEAVAREQVRAPATVVKTIGDAVLVVSRDPVSLVESVLALTEAAKDDLPPLRAGIAHGRAVARLGDWYGPAVNLASRLTARARPDSVLVTNALRDALPDRDAYGFSEAGHKRFKGITDPVPVLRLRRAADD